MHTLLASAVVLVLTIPITACAAGERSTAGATSVSFSPDETRVTVTTDGRDRTFVRPVVTAWKYEPAGRAFWVSPSGKDDAVGTKELPVRTIARAVREANPGDVVYIEAGTYSEALVLTRSGVEGKPIVVSCAPGALGRVRITPPTDHTKQHPGEAVITLHRVQHVWINGLVIEGPRGRPDAPQAEMYGANGITWRGKAGLGCRATNNVVFNNVHCGVKEMGHGGTGILVEGNVIFGNGTESRDHGVYMPADEVTVHGNLIFGNAGYGIHSYAKPRRQTVTRNVCLENKVCGILIAGSENQVSHNVCAFNGRGVFYFRGECRKNVVKNNIFAFNGTDGDYDNGGGKLGDPAENTDDFNCYFPKRPDKRIGAGANSLFKDPTFKDAKGGDFRLADTSPCRRAGTGVAADDPKPDLGAFPTARTR